MGKLSDELNERSKNDHTIIVGSEIRAALAELHTEIERLKDNMGAKLAAGLESYCLTYTANEDGDPFPLVDALTPPDQLDITLGLQERRLLADHLYLELHCVGEFRGIVLLKPD